MYQLLLSPFNKIFYNEWKLNLDQGNYNIVLDQHLEGKLDIPRLTRALKRLVLDYVLLNSHVESKYEELYWIKNSEVYELEYFEDNISNKDILLYIKQALNLEKGPLYRFGLVRHYDDHQHRLVIVLHHIVIDELSVNHFCNELANYYNNECYKSRISIKKQIFIISKLSEELSEYIQLNKDKSKLFWQEKLSNIEPLRLSFLKPTTNQTVQNKLLQLEEFKNIGEIRFNFDKEVLLKLNKLKSKYAITPYLFGQSIYAILLNKHTGQDRFYINYPMVVNEGTDFIYGPYVNLNTILYDFDKIENILDFIDQVRDFILKKLIKSIKHRKIKYSYLPIYDVVSVFGKDALNISFIQTKLKDKHFALENLKVSINSDANVNIPNKLLFEQEVLNNKINYRVRYVLDKIDTDLLIKFIDCYKRFFTEVLGDLAILEDITQLKPVQYYNLLSKEQYNQIIYSWNDTDKVYSDNKTIQALFEEQVERTPDNIAVIYEETRLTYRELNERANKLAHYLMQNHAIKPDTLIALCLDRSEHMLIAILGVLKAGGAYVPIDYSYPDARIQYILGDTSTKLVLTNEVHKKKLKNLIKVNPTNSTYTKINQQIKILTINSERFQEQLVTQSIVNPKTATTSTNLIYVIYTSGTTGNPKGVMIEHKGIVNRIKWMNDMYPLNGIDKILQKTPYVFDLSIWELFWANLYGASIIFIRPEGHKDMKYIIDLINKESITVAYFVPSMLSIFKDTLKTNIEQLNLNKGNPMLSLRYIFCSGEVLSLILVQQYHNILPNTELHNLYGPTEASVDVLYYDCTNKDIRAIYIGKQIDNTKVYVSDINLTPLPIGAIGELYIGGVGLARGYLNRPELTAEKFIANPFQSAAEKLQNKNTRLYKTGDLVRWLPDGNLEYIGRNDFQVKIRGYRIELGEIESVISSYEGIKQSVVLAREHKSKGEIVSKYLVGYYVAKAKLNEEGIINYLQSRLPEYMVPSILIHLESLPLTINGKLDRKALLEPKVMGVDSYVEPRNKLEAQVRQVWAEVLGLCEDKVGIRDNFFRLGGNSILGIRLASKLNKKQNSSISASDIFKYNSVGKLVHYLEYKVQNNKKGQKYEF